MLRCQSFQKLRIIVESVKILESGAWKLHLLLEHSKLAYAHDVTSHRSRKGSS